MKTTLLLLIATLALSGCAIHDEAPGYLYCYHAGPRAKEDPLNDHIYAQCQQCWNEQQALRTAWEARQNPKTQPPRNPRNFNPTEHRTGRLVRP